MEMSQKSHTKSTKQKIIETHKVQQVDIIHIYKCVKENGWGNDCWTNILLNFT